MLPKTTDRAEATERGYALVITVLVALVASALAVTVLSSTESGLRQSRRAGDSSNALQVADAGINAAIKAITNFTGTSSPGCTAPCLVVETTLSGTGDHYRAVATKASATRWHVDSIGTDAAGVRRRVLADAVTDSLVEYGVFAKTAVNFGSGVAVDSFSGGMTQAETCAGRGYVGTNDPANNDLNVSGGGGGVRNCTAQVPKFSDNPKGHVYDGCIGYADTTPVPKFANEDAHIGANGKRTCGEVFRRTPKRSIDDELAELPPTASASPLVCTGPLNLAPGRYRYPSITLADGCVIPAASVTQDNPVKLYTSGPLTIGTGANQLINRPPPNCPGTVASPAGTYSSSGDYYSGTEQSSLSYYCRGWAGRTRIIASGSGTVNFANHARFWGLVNAPNAPVGGGPQAVIWGAFQGSSIVSGSQFSVHFDEALSDITSGRYAVTYWREAPLT